MLKTNYKIQNTEKLTCLVSVVWPLAIFTRFLALFCSSFNVATINKRIEKAVWRMVKYPRIR